MWGFDLMPLVRFVFVFGVCLLILAGVLSYRAGSKNAARQQLGDNKPACVCNYTVVDSNHVLIHGDTVKYDWRKHLKVQLHGNNK